MSKFRDFIKNEIKAEFDSQAADLKKGLGIAPAAGGAGGPPKPPAPPKMPKPSKGGNKQPPKPVMNKPAGAPKPPKAGGMMKEEPGAHQGEEEKYHIYHSGHKLTQDHETVSLGEVHKHYGGVKSLESQGFKLVSAKKAPPAAPGEQHAQMAGPKAHQPADRHAPAPKPSFKKNEEIFAEVMGEHRPKFLGDIKDLAKNSPLIAKAALSYETLSKAGTQHMIAGEHIPNNPAPAPKPKKVAGNKDEGSGGQVKKDEMLMKQPQQAAGGAGQPPKHPLQPQAAPRKPNLNELKARLHSKKQGIVKDEDLGADEAKRKKKDDQDKYADDKYDEWKDRESERY